MSLILGQVQDVDLIVDDNRPKQDIQAALVSLNWLAFGFALAFSSDAEYVMRREDLINKQQAVLYAAVIALGGLAGCLATCLFRSFCGYKPLQIFGLLLGAIGWYVHNFVWLRAHMQGLSVFPLLVFARFLIGISCGISAYITPLYVATSVSPKRRHIVALFPQIALAIGFFICAVGGWSFLRTDVEKGTIFNSLGLQPLLGMSLIVVGLLFTLFYDDRASSEEWLSYATSADYDPLLGDQEGLFVQIREQIRLLKHRHIRNQLFLGFILSLQQLIGINVVLFNATELFSSFFHDRYYNKTSPDLIYVIIGFIYLFASFITPLIAHICKRKTVLSLGALIICVIHLSFSLINFLNHTTSIAYPILGALLIIVFCVSWGPFPWVVISEIFDPRIRCFALTISMGFMWIVMFIFTYFYPPMLISQNLYGAFLLFACFSFVSFIFVNFFVPETKFMSLNEIQEYFKQQN